jgi:hypothetical protein
MSRSRLPRAGIAAALALALGLAACGTTEDVAPAPEDPAEEPAPVEEPEPEPAEDPVDQPEGPVGEDCSAQGAQLTLPEVDGLPDEVVAARDFLFDAALRCDEQLLFTAIEESSQFTYSFGAEGDAIGYWWDLEEAGEQPFLRLAQVLTTTPAIADGGEVVVWPRVTTGRAEDTTDEAWAELFWMTAEELDASQSGTGYLGWRVGIATDGEWRFFVAGD